MAGFVTPPLPLAAYPTAAAAYGQQVALTAALTPYTAQGRATDGETVTSYNGSTVLGTGTITSGQASLNVTSLPAGSNSLKAVYGGDVNFAASTSSTVSYGVTYATTLTPSTTTTT